MKCGRLTDLYLVLLLCAKAFTMMHFLLQLLTLSTSLVCLAKVCYINKENKPCKLINWPEAKAKVFPQVWQ